MKRVLLLGGTGFIGSHVLERLRARPEIRIMVLAHRNVDHRSLEDVNLIVDSLTRWDLSWIETFEPDTIIHAARLGGAGRLRRAIASRRGRRANQRLVDWLVARAPYIRVIYVSGTLVYGDRGETDTDEGSSLNPTAFAREYVRAEYPWMDAQRNGSLPITIVRPPWVVGPSSWFQAHYVRPARRHGEVPVYGSGDNWMTLLDIEDCAGAIVHLAEQATPPATVNLLAPEQWARQRDFTETLARQLGARVLRIDAHDRRLGDRAVAEALTFSLRATTSYASALDGYVWKVPHWPDMLARHASVS